MNDLLGQMVMVGFHGTKVEPELEKMILEDGIGGVILFARNIETKEQLCSLTSKLHELSKRRNPEIPFLISIDQEGGRVFRLPPPFRQYPTYKEFGEKNSKEFLVQNSQLLARELMDVGVNMNMAPVLDVNTNPDNPVIGDRSFGDSPQNVAKLGAIVIDTFKKEGIIPVGKHFPGHGDTAVDSHHALPVVNKTLDELNDIEFFPFKECACNGLSVLMTAHILFPKIDPVYPATISYKILKNILRDQIGFKGVVISDDIEMKGISESYSVEEIVIKGIDASMDIFLCCHTLEKQRKILDTLRTIYAKGGTEADLMGESIKRIIALKRQNMTTQKVNRQ